MVIDDIILNYPKFFNNIIFLVDLITCCLDLKRKTRCDVLIAYLKKLLILLIFNMREILSTRKFSLYFNISYFYQHKE